MAQGKQRKPTSDPYIGQVIGGYLVEEFIGKGAMGRVYRAEQLSLKRPVALKILAPHLVEDRDYVGRFIREAQASAKLVHPNIVQVYDVGSENDIYFIAIEHVDGETVQEKLDREKIIPVDQAVDIVLQAARGIACAQDENIIHRDIKPDNIMLNKRGQAKVADFGLSKVIDESSASDHSDSIVGTPYYMSPEQGEGRELDLRTDIYSLGAFFYHLVTGRPPFFADNFVGVIMKHISEDVRPPHELNQKVPKTISEIIVKMMAKNPYDRYATMHQLIGVLENADYLIDTAVAPRRKKRKKRATARVDAKKAKAEADASLLEGLKRDYAKDADVQKVDAERRQYKRIDAHLVTSIRKKSVTPDQQQKIIATIKNISPVGVFISTEISFPAETILEIRFKLDRDTKEIETIGVVRWISGARGQKGVGVQFVKVRPSDQERITRIMSAPVIGTDISLLVHTALHRKLMKIYYMEMGAFLTMGELMNKLKASQMLVVQCLKDYEKMKLVQIDEKGGIVYFYQTRNKYLKKNIDKWVLDHGLKL